MRPDPSSGSLLDRPSPPAGGEGRSAGLPRGPVAVAVGLTVLLGAVLRWWAPPDLWLDEAQSVAIARVPLGDLPQALREDGAPPLYYLLLHGWTSVWGTGSVAVRSLSAVLGLAALPLLGLLAGRLGGPRAAVAAVLLLAVSPFAVRYSSETRMYSLLVLLTVLLGLAVLRAVRTPGPGSVLAVAGCSAALLHTHYWAAALLGALGLGALAALRRDRPAAVRVLAGVVLGGLAFLPWVPSLLQQLAHTGTPWAEPGGPAVLTAALGAWQGGRSVAAVLLGHLLVVLAVAALVVRRTGPAAVLGAARSPAAWAALVLSVGTLLVAAGLSAASGSGVSGRYTSVALPGFLVLVALGLAALPSVRVATALLVLAVGTSAGLTVTQVDRVRTQAGDVAAALAADARAGDVVLACPDQLGPAVARLAPEGVRLVGYPDLTPVDRLDWTDYAQRNRAADPGTVASRVDDLAGARTVWVVSGRGYLVPSDEDCRAVREALTELRGEPTQVVERDPDVGEGMRVHGWPGA